MSTKSTALRQLEKLNGQKLTLGGFLRAIRQGEALSLNQFASQLAISRQYLCDLEASRRFVSPKTATHFASLLGYDTKQFLRLCLQDLVDRDGIDVTIEVNAA